MSFFRFAAKAVTGTVAAAGAIAALPVLGAAGAISGAGMVVAGAIGVAGAALDSEDNSNNDDISTVANAVKDISELVKS